MRQFSAIAMHTQYTNGKPECNFCMYAMCAHIVVFEFFFVFVYRGILSIWFFCHHKIDISKRKNERREYFILNAFRTSYVVLLSALNAELGNFAEIAVFLLEKYKNVDVWKMDINTRNACHILYYFLHLVKIWEWVFILSH